MATATLPVMEIFGPTLQGEGAMAGQKTMFIRLAGCDYACSWCDTKYSTGRHRDPITDELMKPQFTRMSPQEILGELMHRNGGGVHDGCKTVTISGGNPALHDLTSLLELLDRMHWRAIIETQGSVMKPYFRLAEMVFSPKPPSSDMYTDMEILSACVREAKQGCVLKVVVFDDEDYAYAKRIRHEFPNTPFYIQVGNSNVGDDAKYIVTSTLEAYRQLADKVINDPEMQNVAVLPQIHTLLWGNRRLV